MLIQWKLLVFLFTISLLEISFAGTVCDDFAVRLEEAPDKRSASSRPTQNISGCVEVCYNDEYRGLCSPVFDEREAAVVCRELGFYAALDYDECPLSGADLGTGVPFPFDVDCTGTESSLSECSLSNYTVPCNYTTVTCTRSVYFQLTRTQYSTSEFEDIEICVELVAGVTVEDVIISLESVHETATEDSDYQALYEYLTFPPNSSAGDQQCTIVSINEDDLVEFEEHLSIIAIGVGGATQEAEFVPWRDSADVIIVDNDILEIGFAEASYTVDEGHGHVRVCAEILSLEALELQRVIEFRLTTSDGSATDGGDYQSSTQLLAFHIGDTQNSLRCADIWIVNDLIQEDQETFSAEIVVSDLAVLVAPGRESTTIRIIDDDGFQIYFTNNTPNVTGGVVTIEFVGNFPIQSAHCLIELHSSKPNLWENCTSQRVVFEIIQLAGRRRYPIYVNATSFDGQVAYLARDVRRENRFCSAHLINEGVTVEGNQVEVEWQGTGPNSGGGGRADLFYCTLPGRSTTPCSSPFVFTFDVGAFELQVQADDSGNLCTVRNSLILFVPFVITEGY